MRKSDVFIFKHQINYSVRCVLSEPICVQQCALCIAQVPFALPFDCNQPNDNLGDLWSTQLQFRRFWKKINIYNFYVYY